VTILKYLRRTKVKRLCWYKFWIRCWWCQIFF